MAKKKRRRFESKAEREARQPVPGQAPIGVVRLPILAESDSEPAPEAEPPADDSVAGPTPFWKERRKA